MAPVPMLPPDGKLVYVSPKRQFALWIAIGGFVYVALMTMSIAIKVGSLASFSAGIAALVLTVISIRIPMSGILLGSEGVKLRTPVWTYLLPWSVIKTFEIPFSSGLRPRLLIHLYDGKVKGAQGFFARGAEEEARAQALLQALNSRLSEEQQHRVAAAHQ